MKKELEPIDSSDVIALITAAGIILALSVLVGFNLFYSHTKSIDDTTLQVCPFGFEGKYQLVSVDPTTTQETVDKLCQAAHYSYIESAVHLKAQQAKKQQAEYIAAYKEMESLCGTGNVRTGSSDGANEVDGCKDYTIVK